nr:hypothetical protein [Tanacetum cinerariifolium]
MLKLRASQEGLEVRMTDDDIIDKVLGTSRGFTPGRGRKLPNSASYSSVCSYPAPTIGIPSCINEYPPPPLLPTTVVAAAHHHRRM